MSAESVFIPKSCCIRADGACFEEGECLSDCEALDQVLLRGASERELRQRLERAERDRNEWRTQAEALAGRIAALEAGIGRLIAQWEEEDDWVPAGEEERARYRLAVGKTDELRALLRLTPEEGAHG